jgi:S1-C subfamily serine protease
MKLLPRLLWPLVFSLLLIPLTVLAQVTISALEGALGPAIWNSRNPELNTTCGENISQFGLLTEIRKGFGVAVSVEQNQAILCWIFPNPTSRGLVNRGAELQSVRTVRCEDPTKCFYIASDAWLYDHEIRSLKTLIKAQLPSGSPAKKYPNVSEFSSSGSGFFISRSGYFVTNYHVIEGAESIEVEDALRRRHNAVVFRADAKNDLAILKIDGSPPGVLSIARSNGVRRGLKVYAFGFPRPGIQGLELKVTDGIVSSLSGLMDDPRTFQVTNPIQPGNSGGALIAESGQVIGIVVATLKLSPARGASETVAQNVNYAIKSNYLIEMLESIGSIKIPVDTGIMFKPHPSAIQNGEKASGRVVVSGFR